MYRYISDYKITKVTMGIDVHLDLHMTFGNILFTDRHVSIKMVAKTPSFYQ